MLPKSYTSFDSGPKSPLTHTWLPSPNFVNCLSESSNSPNNNVMLTTFFLEVVASKFHVLDDPIDFHH
jgi:hypothetical protein